MKKKFLFTTLTLFFGDLYAQEIKPVRDFGYWVGLAIEKKIHKDFKLEVEQQVRTFHNGSKLNNYFLDVGIRYTIDKRFKLGGNIRYIYDIKRSSETENNYRYNLDIEYKNRISKKLKFAYRLRYQKEYVNLFINYSTNEIYKSAVRNKLEFVYDYNLKNDIYLTAEIFRVSEIFKKPYFNKLRFEAGDIVDTKLGKFDFSVGLDKELNSKYPYWFYFVKTIYILEL